MLMFLEIDQEFKDQTPEAAQQEAGVSADTVILPLSPFIFIAS